MSTATITAARTGSGAGMAAMRASRMHRGRPSVRSLLVGRVRARIAAGSYVTEHKIDTAAARLFADIACGLPRAAHRL